MNLKTIDVSQKLPLFISLISIFYACSSAKDDHVPQEKFPIATAVIKDTTYIKEYIADIHSIQNVEIRAKSGGYLESIHVDEGQYVNKGQLLFRISSQQLKQDLLKAQAALASATAEAKASEVELKNAKTLVDKNIISQTEFDLAWAKLEALNAKIEEAKAHEGSASLQLSFAQIKAPFSGIINRIPNKTGSLIEDGALLTTLSNNEEVFAYFNVSENDYLDYVNSNQANESKEISLRLANNSLYPHKGKIETIESEFNKNTGNIAFRARFPNPDKILKHGATGKVQITKAIKNALLIPQKSTFEIQGNTYIFLIDKNNEVQMRKIFPSVRLPHFYIIGSGLSANERFIYEGIQRVKEGDIIETEVVQLAQIINR